MNAEDRKWKLRGKWSKLQCIPVSNIDMGTMSSIVYLLTLECRETTYRSKEYLAVYGPRTVLGIKLLDIAANFFEKNPKTKWLLIQVVRTTGKLRWKAMVWGEGKYPDGQ